MEIEQMNISEVIVELAKCQIELEYIREKPENGDNERYAIGRANRLKLLVNKLNSLMGNDQEACE